MNGDALAVPQPLDPEALVAQAYEALAIVKAAKALDYDAGLALERTARLGTLNGRAVLVCPADRQDWTQTPDDAQAVTLTLTHFRVLASEPALVRLTHDHDTDGEVQVKQPAECTAPSTSTPRKAWLLAQGLVVPLDVPVGQLAGPPVLDRRGRWLPDNGWDATGGSVMFAVGAALAMWIQGGFSWPLLLGAAVLSTFLWVTAGIRQETLREDRQADLARWVDRARQPALPWPAVDTTAPAKLDTHTRRGVSLARTTPPEPPAPPPAPSPELSAALNVVSGLARELGAADWDPDAPAAGRSLDVLHDRVRREWADLTAPDPEMDAALTGVLERAAVGVADLAEQVRRKRRERLIHDLEAPLEGLTRRGF